MFTFNSNIKNEAEKIYQNAMLMISGEKESDFMLENLLAKAARLKHPHAAGELGIHLFYVADSDAEYKKAIEFLLMGMKGSHLLSRLYYAYCYHDGLGVSRNNEKAAKELELFVNEVKAYKQNKMSSNQIIAARLNEHYCIALTGLAYKYVHGEGVKIDIQKATLLLSTAESLGSKVAKQNLAILMLLGVNTAKSENEKNQRAKIWLQKLTQLAEENYSEAQQDLALYYYYGNPLIANSPRDVEKAKLLFWNAALGGKADCFYHLSQIYIDLNNPTLAFDLLKLGTLTGSKSAMLTYGKYLYNDEKSTLEEKMSGINYIKTIADMGDAAAESQYGSIIIEAYNAQAHASDNVALRDEGITYLRKAARTYPLAKLELAEALTTYPGKDNKAAFTEANQNLLELIAHREDENDIVYKSFLEIQNQAKILLAKLPELARKAKLKHQDEIKIEEKTNKPESVTVKKKLRQRKAHKITHFPLRHRRVTVTYLQDGPEEEMLGEANDADPAPKKSNIELENETKLDEIVLNPAPANELILSLASEVEEIKPIEPSAAIIPPAEAIPLAPALVTPVYTRLPKPLPRVVVEVLKKLESRGYRAYVVGGLTRNILLGIDSITDDIDIVTDASIKVIEKTFQATRHLHVPNLVRFTQDNRSFDIVHSGNLKSNCLADALSRDFSINALYADSNGNVIDPLGRGLQDLNHAELQLQTVLPADESFKIDPFRILRYLYFLSKEFKGAITSPEIVKYLQQLQWTLVEYKEKAIASDEFICEKVRLYEIFDGLICKFFMNGKALEMFKILHDNYFFAIFFHAQLTQGDQDWLTWRFQKMDENIRFTKNRLYGMLLAAMLKNKYFQKADVNAMLDAAPYPCTLRWYNPLMEDVQIWMNEKTLFNCLPLAYRQSLYEKTNYELSLAVNQRRLSFSNAKPLETQLPAFFTEKVYQKLGHFGHAINTFSPPTVLNYPPTPMFMTA
jgi:tRNA nucleotidyltransferase/poly(A) polymerase/TPR repeat protein